MAVRRLCAFCAIVLGILAPAAQAGGTDLAAAFGTRQTVRGMSISPDGDKVAYLTPDGDVASGLVVADIATGNTRKLLSSLGQRNGNRIISLNQVSGQIVDWLPDDPDHVLMQVELAREDTRATRLANTGEGLSLQKVDIGSNRMSREEGARREATDYITDAAGKLRAMAMVDAAANGALRDRISYYYRTKTSSEWRLIGGDGLVGPPALGT